MPFRLFFGHRDTPDEFDKAITVALWRNWRNLRSVVRHALEEVFNLLDGSILRKLAMACLSETQPPPSKQKDLRESSSL